MSTQNTTQTPAQAPAVELNRRRQALRQQQETRVAQARQQTSLHAERARQLDAEHAELNSQITEWDNDTGSPGGLRDRVARESSQARWRRALLTMLTIYLIVEALMLMDVINHELSARFGNIGPASTFAASLAVAVLFAAMTLFVKGVKEHRIAEVRHSRAALDENDFTEDQKLRWQLHAWKVLGAVYLVFVGMLYLQVHHFSLERGHLLAGLAEEAAAPSASFNVNVGGQEIAVGASSVAPAGPGASTSTAVSAAGLAGGTLALLGVLWAIHAGVWFAPSAGIWEPLPLAGFRREVAHARMQRAARERDLVLRQSYQEVVRMPDDIRQAVVPLLAPVARLVNAAVGGHVIEPPPPFDGMAQAAATATATAVAVAVAVAVPGAAPPAPDAAATAPPAPAAQAQPGGDANDPYAGLFGT